MTTPSFSPGHLGLSAGDIVVDEKGSQYRIENLVGRGGQGAVYAVEGGRYAVKTVTNASKRERDALRHRIEYVRRLDLKGLPIARPRTMLREPTGYVMDLLDGVVPLSDLSHPPREVDPQDLVAWHVATGGLRKRLRVLARVADTLAQLGGRALVYGDLSPMNVLVSRDPQHAEAWLIDPDNIHHAGGRGARPIYTPRYGAPELVRQEAPAALATDAHALAVLVYETLTLSHPLVGDAVADAEPEVEAAAHRGEWPYVHHPTDGRNRCSTGLPLEGVTTKAMRALFERAFTEGIGQPSRRPSPAQWRDALLDAVDLTAVEPESSATTIPGNDRRCFWTDRPLGSLAFGTFRRWVPHASELGIPPSATGKLDERIALTAPKLTGRVRGEGWGGIVLNGSEPFILTRRHVHSATGSDAEHPCLRLTYLPSDQRVYVEPLDDGLYSIHTLNIPIQKRGIRVKSSSRFMIHLGPLESAHRIADIVPVD